MIKSIAITLLGLLLVVSQSSYAKTEEKTWNSEHIELIHKFLDHYNSNDQDKIEAYYKENLDEALLKAFPMERFLYDARNNFLNFGEFNFHSILKLKHLDWQQELSILVQSKRTEQWVNLSLWLNNNHRKITGIRVQPAEPEDIPTSTKTHSDRRIKKILNTYLNNMEKKDVFSGAVLLAKDGDVLLRKAYGYASKRFDAKNTPDTKFNLASVGKLFTSVAVMQLVEKGKLSLDDNLDQYVSEAWLPTEHAKRLKIKHLITHSSGLGDFFNEDFANTPLRQVTSMESYQPFVVTDKLRFEPGSKFMYSNNAMQLLGVVIEKVSGQSYYDYVHEHIFLPAGMQNSGSYDTRDPNVTVATGYYRNQERLWESNILLLPPKASAAGGMYSTVDDMHSFARALLNGKYLTENNQGILFTTPKALPDSNYGHGFEVYEAPSTKQKRVGHSGGFEGVSANIDIYLDQGYIAIVLSNYRPGSGPVVSKIRELLAHTKH